jgi:hypothetical protein
VQLLFRLVFELTRIWSSFTLKLRISLLSGLAPGVVVDPTHAFDFLEEISLGCKLRTVTLESGKVVRFPQFGFTNLQKSNDLSQIIKVWMTSLGLDSRHYASHSLKIGSIHAADSVGMPDRLMNVMGRWRSEKMLGHYIGAVRSMRELAAGLKERWPRSAPVASR